MDTEKIETIYNVYILYIELHNNHKQILCVLNLGIRQAKLYIDWSKEMLDSLENEK